MRTAARLFTSVERIALLTALVYLWRKFRPSGPNILATDGWPPVAPKPVPDHPITVLGQQPSSTRSGWE